MTTVPVSPFGPAIVPNANTQMLIAPNQPAAIVVLTRLMVTNITAGVVGLKVWVVRAGLAGPVDAQLIVGASAGGLPVPAGPVDALPLKGGAGLVLNPGDALWAWASAANALNLTASGWATQ